MFLSFLLFLFQYPIQNLNQASYLVRHYSVEDGLPVNSINQIVQDSSGFLYFATYNGLVRYDGYEFKTYNSSNTPGIENDRFAGMIISSLGTIWLVNGSGLITSYKNEIFHTYNKNDSITENINSLIEDHNQTIWVANQNGLNFLKPNDSTFVPFKSDILTQSITALSTTSEKTIIGVSDQGLFEIKNNIVSIILEAKQFPISPSGSLTTKKLSNGFIFVLNSKGLFAYNPSTKELVTFNNKLEANITFWNIFEFSSSIVVSTTKGFFEVDLIHKKLIKKPIEYSNSVNGPNNIIKQKEYEILFGDQVMINGAIVFRSENVKTGFVDNEQSIWVSSATKGLYQLRKSIITNIHTIDSFSIENTYSLIQAKDKSFWVGSLLNGVFHFKNNETKNWNDLNSPFGSNHVSNLFQDSDQSIYAGFEYNGLWKFENDNWQKDLTIDRLYKAPKITIKAMFRAKNNQLFIGTNQDLIIKTDSVYKKTNDVFGFELNEVRVIKQAKNDALFFGTNGNGLGILKADSSFSIFNTNNGLSSNFIRDVFVQSQDTIWLATENKGLTRLLFYSDYTLKSSSFITSEDGLIENSLHRIIQDRKNNLWISSNSGIMSISKSKLNSYADKTLPYLPVTRFNQRDGMLSQEANGGVQSAGFLSTENMLWFPNQRGITIFDLNKLDSVALKVSILPVIESVQTPYKLIPIKNKSNITLDLGIRNVAIHFTAPNFAHPERTTFFYQLSEVNEHWVKANQSREANFTNLSPGTYLFSLKVELTDGTDTHSNLTLIIPPFFYETTLFRLLLLCLIAALIFFAVQLRIMRLKKREHELERRVKLQTEELEKAAEEKSRFFSGITHELKTPLSLILAPLDDYLEQKSTKNETKLLKNISLIHRNGYRLKNLVDQILDVSKLKADAIKLSIHPFNIITLTNQIIGQFQSLLEQNGIQLELISDSINEPIYVDKDAWERIILNLFSNAIKYSPENSKIQLIYKNEPNFISVHVKDFGKGISKENQEHIFGYLYQVNENQAAEGTGIGLFLVKGLVERLGGSVSIESEVDKGAEFIVQLKKGSSHFSSDDFVSHEPIEESKKVSLISDSPNSDEISELESEKKSEQTILIVEDNNDFRMYLESMLTEKYQIITAKNGKEGLQIIIKSQPDLILSDVMMPIMGGIEFIQNVRQINQFKHIPVVFLTARNRDKDIQQGLSTGADVYLTKPIRSSILLSQIEAILRRERILSGKLSSETINKVEPELVSKLREITFRQLANPILNIDFLATNLFMSRTNLYRSWKQVSEISISDFIKKVRFEEALTLIQERNFSIQQAAHAVGFSDPNYFSTSFKKTMGFSPSEIKKPTN